LLIRRDFTLTPIIDFQHSPGKANQRSPNSLTSTYGHYQIMSNQTEGSVKQGFEFIQGNAFGVDYGDYH